MSNTPMSLTRSARMLLVALGVAVVSGCATHYPSGSTQQEARYVLTNDNASLLNDDNLNGFLSQAPAGGVLSVASSPWGNNVQLLADAPYLAASGRECRQVRVTQQNGSSRAALTCETPNGWVHQRLVTHALEGR
ncbi:DVU3141 family protein [Vreelandella zhaodongensis]|uniref:DVU3141 family protein n=1 Tax=Vreelandella zhaodongensis TaxID=1176240 RepID=UPI003EBC40DD